jgi:galactokinase/mevalonate kinase-like predicted kinase
MDDKERVTMERVQYLAKHNKQLDESWNLPLNMLDKMVNNNLKKFAFTMKLIWETKKQSKKYVLVKSGDRFVKFVDEDGKTPGNNFGLDFF